MGNKKYIKIQHARFVPGIENCRIPTIVENRQFFLKIFWKKDCFSSDPGLDNDQLLWKRIAENYCPSDPENDDERQNHFSDNTVQ